VVGVLGVRERDGENYRVTRRAHRATTEAVQLCPNKPDATTKKSKRGSGAFEITHSLAHCKQRNAIPHWSKGDAFQSAVDINTLHVFNNAAEKIYTFMETVVCFSDSLW